MSRPLPWVLSLPLMGAGCLAAHTLAYRLVEPGTADAAHGYLAAAPLVLAVSVALGAVVAGRAAFAGRRRSGGSSSLFALLPPLAFTLQEHLEHALHEGAVPLGTALEPGFLLGLLLQLPFAGLAYLIARGFVRVAEAAGWPPERPRVQRAARILHAVSFDLGPTGSALASPQAERAPPLPA